MTAALTANHHPACYPSDGEKALSFFRDVVALHPKLNLPAVDTSNGLVGIVAPHIDFRVSLRAYSAAFAPLMNEPLADTYIILGVGHKSRLEWNLDRRDYQTPLGHAECATDIVELLADGANEKFLFSAAAHEGEHSIEFPLVWLQALHQMHPDAHKKPVRFAPVLCGGLFDYVEGMRDWDSLTEFHRLSEALGGVLRDAAPGKIRVIVSIDGCHMGPRFRHPFRVTPKLLKATAAWEEHLWTQVESGDVRLFLDWMRAEGNDRYFDGVGALALLLAATKDKPLKIKRTYYEQWFTENDASTVTFSSGTVLA